MINLVLPYPVSANMYWRTFMPKGFKAPVTTLSSEAKAYKAEVRKLCMIAGVKEPIEGRVSVAIKLYPQRPQDWAKRAQKNPEGWDDDVRCIDLDNANKVLFDALKGIAIVDDKWVRKIVSERCEPDGNARVELVISPIINSGQQLGLI